MNIMHEKWKNGDPFYGDRSKTHPGCALILEKAYFHKKSSTGDARPASRPKFIGGIDKPWLEFQAKVRSEMPKYEADQFLEKKKNEAAHIIGDHLASLIGYKISPLDSVSYFRYEDKYNDAMKIFCCSVLDNMDLTIPESRDFFAKEEGDGIYYPRTTSETAEPKSSESINAGWVYMITSPYDNCVKIGQAKENQLHSRIQEGQRHRKGAQLYLAANVSYYHDVEQKIIKECAPYLCDGNCLELFELPPAVMKEVEQQLRAKAHDIVTS